MQVIIDPHKELFIWRPIDGQLIYPDYFNHAFREYAKHAKGWPDLLGVFYQGKMVYILDNQAMRENGKINFSKYIFPDKAFAKGYHDWQEALADFVSIQWQIQALNQHSFYSGMTSHAAIASREFGIPCLVNTKIATQVLGDGDIAEVDTKQGILKRLA